MNAKLAPLNYKNLRHVEFGQFIVRFFEDFVKTGMDAATDPDFQKMFQALQNQIPSYNAALDQVRASEESEKIAAADTRRDADFQALKDSIKPYRNARTPQERDAYTAVNLILNQYKNVNLSSFEEETNRLNSLTAKLLAPEMSSHIDALGILKFVENIGASNTAFNDIFSKRSFQTSQKITYDVKVLRENLTADYRKMSNYISTLAGVKEDKFYKDTLAIINNGRKYFGDVVLARRNRPNPSPGK